MAPTRIFVQEGVYEETLQKIIGFASTRVTGDPFLPTTTNGPLISRKQVERVQNYVNTGVKEGATLAFGGKTLPGPGFYFEPTVFTNVQDHMTIAREEIFGPVISVFKFKTLEEAIKRANDTDYGLGAGVFTKDIEKAFEVANAVRAGYFAINCWMVPSTSAPIGGFKSSGKGREFGEAGLKLYLESKTVMVKRSNTSLP